MKINIASLPTFVALLFNIYVLMLVMSQDYRKRTSHIFSILIILFIIWDIFDFGLRNTVSAAHGLLFSKLLWTPVALIAPVYLNFALLFPTERPILRNKLSYVLLYFPALITIYLVWFTNSFISDTLILRSVGGRTPVFGPLISVYSLYTFPFLLMGLSLFLYSWVKSRGRRERLQGKWMFLASFIPIAGGSLTNIVMPSIGYYIFPLATSFTVIMALMVVNAITKYRIMSITPRYAAETIIAMLPHSIILLDTDQKILYVNKKLTDVLGFRKEELIGQHVKKILHEDERVFGLAWQTINDGKTVEKSVVKFLSKNRNTVKYYFSGAVARDGEDTIGFIGLGTEMENQKG